MESLLRRKEMRESRYVILLLSLVILQAVILCQETDHYYNVDTEKRVRGTIQKIVMEPRYKDSSPFLIVILEEKKTKEMFNVEVSPVRFFSQDFHKGEELEVVGSIYSKDGQKNIIARQIRFRGEIFMLRDKHGFPAWRGGEMSQKKKRKGKRF
jgi:hypothetical protein